MFKTLFQIAVVCATLSAIESGSSGSHKSHSKDSNDQERFGNFVQKGSRSSRHSKHDSRKENSWNKENSGDKWNKGNSLNKGSNIKGSGSNDKSSKGSKSSSKHAGHWFDKGSHSGKSKNDWNGGNFWNKGSIWRDGDSKDYGSRDKSSKVSKSLQNVADKFKGIGNTWLHSKLDAFKNKYADMKKSQEVTDDHKPDEEGGSSEVNEAKTSHDTDKKMKHSSTMSSKSKSKTYKSQEQNSHKSSLPGSENTKSSKHEEKKNSKKSGSSSSNSKSLKSSKSKMTKSTSRNSSPKYSGKTDNSEKEKSKMTKQLSLSNSKDKQWPTTEEKSKLFPWQPSNEKSRENKLPSKEQSKENNLPSIDKSKPFPWQPPKEGSKENNWPPMGKSKPFPWQLPNDKSKENNWPPLEKSKPFPWQLPKEKSKENNLQPTEKSKPFPWQPPKEKSKPFPWQPPKEESKENKLPPIEKSKPFPWQPPKGNSKGSDEQSNDKTIQLKENKTNTNPNDGKSKGNQPFPPKSRSFSPEERKFSNEETPSKAKPTKEKEELPRFGPTLKPPYKKPKMCKKVTPSCCVGGEITVDLNHGKGKKGIQGSVEGISVLGIEKSKGKDKKQPCSSSTLIMVDFDKIDSTGCFGCLEAPYCGKRMLKVQLKLSNAKRKGWLFNIGDSESNNGYGGDSDNQVNDAETQALFPNITVYPSDRCPTITSLMHIVNAVASHVDIVTLYISNEFIKITNSDGLDFKLCNKCLYALNGQPDSGPKGGPNERICIGINRVVKDLSRTGYGICSANLTWECPWCA